MAYPDGRVEIPVTEVTRAGVEVPAYVAADTSNQHYVDENAGDVEIEVFNNDAAPQTITVVANPNVFNDGLTLLDLELTIPAGEVWRFGPFRPNTFRQDPGGGFYLNASDTDLNIRAFKREQARNA